jgi:hypothetical protein
MNRHHKLPRIDLGLAFILISAIVLLIVAALT